MLELLTSHRRWGDFTIEPEELAERWSAIEPLDGPDAVRAFFDLYADKQGKPGARWGDKTPGYVKSMREIQAYLPEARFIHLIRDGRDVALSVLKQTWGPQSIEAAAEKWRSRVTRGRSQAAVPRLLHGGQVRGPRPPHRARAATDLRVHRAPLRRADARLPRDRRAAAAGEGAGAAARPRRGAVGREAPAQPREDVRAPEPGDDRNLEAADERRRTGAAYEALAGDLLADLGYEIDRPNGAGEVHRPRRGPRLPRPVRRAVAMAKHGHRRPRSGRAARPRRRS